jgi:hypothetical protein
MNSRRSAARDCGALLERRHIGITRQIIVVGSDNPTTLVLRSGATLGSIAHSWHIAAYLRAKPLIAMVGASDGKFSESLLRRGIDTS